MVPHHRCVSTISSGECRFNVSHQPPPGQERGKSSRNRMPLCARLTSQGGGRVTPPIGSALKTVRCGERKGRVPIMPPFRKKRRGRGRPARAAYLGPCSPTRVILGSPILVTDRGHGPTVASVEDGVESSVGDGGVALAIQQLGSAHRAARPADQTSLMARNPKSVLNRSEGRGQSKLTRLPH